MIKTITTETFICDLCSKEKATKMQLVNYPVWFTTEQTEGRYVKPYISQQKFDACEECMAKIIKIQGSGAQGHNKYCLIK